MRILKSMKDAIFSFLIRTALKIKLKRYGDMIDFKIDSSAHKIYLSVSLKGEHEPLIVTVNEYAVVNEGGKDFVELRSITTSKEWMNLVAEDFLKGKRFELPEKGGGIVKMVID
jgi:hypothetical protein